MCLVSDENGHRQITFSVLQLDQGFCTAICILQGNVAVLLNDNLTIKKTLKTENEDDNFLF